MGTPTVTFIAGNWKMHTDRDEAKSLATSLGEQLQSEGSSPADRSSRVEVGLFPPYPFLCDVGEIAERFGFRLGAQDMYFEPVGAFTGEVSGAMLASTGCRYVILGHSERRHVLGETDEIVARKVRAALASGLAPVICVGETIEQREAGNTEDVLRTQIESAVDGLSENDFEKVTVAYEPVWAIGTGHTATPDQASDAHAFLRTRLADRFGADAASACRILYGGSVKPDNAKTLLAQDEIQGALVGGASLQAASFADIVRAALAVHTS